jgi:ubiquinone/menaquinone biosynthesis C-methylase UbiE
MRTFRQRYYDSFSDFYDRFVALHSRHRHGKLRDLVADSMGLTRGDRVLDICTGTGTALCHLRKRVGEDGAIVGMDFSKGMLEAAQAKVLQYDNVFLIQGDAASLPFKKGAFDAATCSFAFYELRSETQEDFLQQVGAVLKIGKPFVMVEHDIPKNSFVRILFYLRLFSMGRRRALEILKHEQFFLARHFRSVKRIAMPASQAKIIICKN